MTNQTNKLQIKSYTYKQLLNALSNKKTEQGGIIGCSKENVIDNFYFDKSPVNSSISSYTPNAKVLTEIINVKWAKKNIRFIGMIHSHLINKELSEEDIEFARDVLNSSTELNFIIMGICQLDYSYVQKGIAWYQVFQDEIISTDIIIVQEA